jgi:retron-type reverse transcriptase
MPNKDVVLPLNTKKYVTRLKNVQATTMACNVLHWFTALLHHISIDCLRMAFFALKRDAASGVDGLTWPTYEADLDRNLTDLHERVHRGAYRALPSRRTYIPKADGKQR